MGRPTWHPCIAICQSTLGGSRCLGGSAPTLDPCIRAQVGRNDFPRTAWNQRDASVFSLQLLEFASLLNDWYKAKRVVVGCILPLPAASCT